MNDHLDADELDRLSAWCGSPVAVLGQLSGGASNTTWAMRLGDRRAILRHPPRGRPLLPTAHDVRREAIVLRALASFPVPVPAVFVSCDDLSVIGVPFVITEHRPGVCLLTATTPEIDERALAHQAVDILAAIHAVAPESVGLDVREGHGYLARQIDRWRRQLATTPTAERLGDVEPIATWLENNRPAHEERTLVHGDYGFHNLLVSPARIEAVLDWELCTFGDPVADLYSFLKSWGPGASSPNAANDAVACRPLAPTHAEMLERYASVTGRDVVAHRSFYDVFGLWRSIGIFEGIHARSGGIRFVDETPRLVARAKGMMAAAPDPR